jgi:hypothetical protein
VRVKKKKSAELSVSHCPRTLSRSFLHKLLSMLNSTFENVTNFKTGLEVSHDKYDKKDFVWVTLKI